MSKKIKIGTKIYKSIIEAAKHCHRSPSTIYKKVRTDSKKDKNLIILPEINTKKKPSSKCCPVLCQTTGERFESISALAKALNMDAWTLSLKMETAGYFVDSNKNKYIRLQPMHTSVKYPMQRPDMRDKKIVLNSKENEITKEAVKALNIESQKNILNINNIMNGIKTIAIDNINKGDYTEASKYIAALAILNNKQ